MIGSRVGATPEVVAYAAAYSTPLDEVERSVVERTARLGGPAMMQTPPQQARLLGTLVGLMGARSVVELGTFTGLTTLAMARALPAGGRVLTCDLSPTWTGIAREHWERAGVADRVELHLAPALEVVRSLPERSVDLAYLDADKGGYAAYLLELLPRMRPGGVIVADNVLADGAVTGTTPPGSVAEAMHRFNETVLSRPELDVNLLPLGDGLSLVRVRS